ncbi:hypothetical protein OC610_08510 [Pseudomonas sp. SAICEU22]|uniref:Heme utilization protein n=1 Tax=Pseudomonas agronomica TaxID=2979328 RepID=A0ABT3F5S4_9PSED|nr:hypothetical protein [Pseudomonas agronomica]MCW1244444.1 hypothetical protein [Pseudomonas agronomica]
MKSKLILTLALSVLAASTFAADGFDRTGSAAAIKRQDLTDSATIATDDHDRTHTATVATDDRDHADSARTD